MHAHAYDLSSEVRFLHLEFFGSPAPQGLIDAYLKFHVESPTLVQATPDEMRTIVTVVSKQLDALGIEPWLRGGTTRHLLSRKLLLIAYLAECDALHPQSRQSAKGRLRSFFCLGSGAMWGGWHLLTGRLQVLVYGLL